MLLLACGLGNGALLTHNKQVCTLMSVGSHRPVLGEHLYRIIYIFTTKHSAAHTVVSSRQLIPTTLKT